MSSDHDGGHRSVRVALLTVSDSAAAGEASDLSGSLLHKMVTEFGWNVIRLDIVADEEEAISDWLRRAADELRIDLAMTSGGTGLGPRDVTPEATRAVLEREAPGIAEAIRATGMSKTPRAMLSRNVAGIRGETLIINLSGSPKAVREQWECLAPVIEHAVETVQGRGHHLQADAERRQSTSAPEISKPAPKASGQGTLLGTPGSEPSKE